MVTTNGKEEPPNKHWFSKNSCLKRNLIKAPKTRQEGCLIFYKPTLDDWVRNEIWDF